MTPPFWKTTPLQQLTSEQWESLCDGCGICCLQKYQHEPSGQVYYAAVACRFLDVPKCRCTVYENRHRRNPNCIALKPANIDGMHWLPDTCAYRLIAAGQDLNWWHPLISGDPETVHQAGISVRDRVISGTHIHPKNLEWFF